MTRIEKACVDKGLRMTDQRRVIVVRREAKEREFEAPSRNFPQPCAVIGGIRKDSAMVRLLSILAFGALCVLPGAASADQLKPQKSSASDLCPGGFLRAF